MNESIHIVFDIGGTKMRIAAVTNRGIEDSIKSPTPLNPREGMQILISAAREVSRGRTISSIAGCSRWIIKEGIFLPGDKVLTQWGGTHISAELQNALRAPVYIVHDTAAIGLGEVHEGAGRGSKICAYITVSTGVGGDRIVNGVIDRSNVHPEIGRQIVNGEWLENLVSGTAVKKKFGIEPKDLASLEERNNLADILAIGLYNTALHWTPDTFVLGGSMIVGINPIPLERTRDSFAKLREGFPSVPRIEMAMLGDDGGLRGAAILAQQMIDSVIH